MKKITIAFLAFIALAAIATAQSYTISTFAGNGTYGVAGDGGQATAAQLSTPWGICSDGAGNVYIADYSSNRVRKITPAGVITTFAGTGAAGYSGDGGQATAANLYWPCGVYADAGGNIYIGDAQNERIRKVAPGGIITTFAGTGVGGFSGDGGQATAAQISYPTGVWGDPAGNILIADQSNYRVRRVSSAGIITTVAGHGVAGYGGDGGQATAASFYISHVCSDASGNVYIADWFDNRVRFVNIVTGIITTLAGNGTAGFSGDGGQATAAMLTQPGDMNVDAAGNVYIADGANSSDNHIRMVKPGGVISTIAGNGVGAFCCDGSPATAAEINCPEGVCLDGAGNIYIADYGNYRGRKLTGAPLPITLISFDAYYAPANFNVQLGWVTASEINNKEFTIEKQQTNGGEEIWMEVANVPGAGNSCQTRYYSATDETIYPGTIYYRLKQTDYDGNFTYSNVQDVNIPESDFVSIFPNPVADNNLTLHYSNTQAGDVTISVVSTNGAEAIAPYTLSNLPKGTNNYPVNTATLAKGIYILVVASPQHTYYSKFVKL